MRRLTSCAALACAFGSASAQTIQINVDVTKDVRPISPYIYGHNQPDWGAARSFTLVRQGGNRLSAYNWENNASNAGSDWSHQNDNYLGGGTTPAEVPRFFAAQAHANNMIPLVTVPITGYVAADINGGGDVANTPDYLNVRFRRSYSTKPTAFSLNPNLTDGNVYQDEFVWSLRQRLANNKPVWYSLDNEPDLWWHTHPRIRPNIPSYVDFLALSKDYASAIKRVEPNSLVFGAVNYGWSGFQEFQNAPDKSKGFFLDYYLQEMKKAHDASGTRLLDVMDVHWYPEVYVNGRRIVQDDLDTSMYAARMQAPRSLWDPTYDEGSWVSQWGTGGPIKLLRFLKTKIDTHYPGTKLAITEWNYGGGANITGGVAAADVLGIFGREGLFAASHWNMRNDERYVYAAFKMFRDFDGNGAKFGDTSVMATTSDVAKVTAYASTHTDLKGSVTLVLINKQSGSQSVSVKVAGTSKLKPTLMARLQSGLAAPVSATPPAISGDTVTVTLPATSVTTIRLSSTDPLGRNPRPLPSKQG